jgi:riboflavin kinase/FMN adenylyltransferase
MPASIQVFRSLEAARGRFAPSAVTIGNFDGVHLGHRELMRRLLGRGAKPSVVTFHPHPTSVVALERAPRLMSTLEQRIEWMREAGVEQVLAVPFDIEFSRLSPPEFARLVLAESAGARLVVVGDNFRFGHRQAGDTALLAELGVAHGFRTETVAPISWRGRVVSSTAIRNAVEGGGVGLALRMLGRPYSLEGVVVRGHGVGSTQTVSTLNLATDAVVLPLRGVYVTRVRDLDTGRRWPSITNVGFRPTFGGDALTIESHVVEGYADPAPERIAVDFLHRVREERKFDDAAALKAQILRDVGRARAWWRRVALSTHSFGGGAV